jgi:hypothetical protein
MPKTFSKLKTPVFTPLNDIVKRTKRLKKEIIINSK